MSTPDNHPEAGLLRMLRAALRSGLAPAADDEAFAMARSAAQIVGLPGLDACLAALGPLRGAEWPEPALEVVEALERLAAEDSLAAVRAHDAELKMRADVLQLEAPAGTQDAGGAEGEEESFAPAEPPLGTLAVEEALVDLPLAADGATTLARGARLDRTVATALRAALEWMLSDLERPRPFRLRAEDSVLEVRCEGVKPDGLLAAHEVLADVDGGLAPLGETSPRSASGTWLLRVPAWSPRPVHLMLEQGPLRLAVPWHAVLRLSLVPAIEIEERGGSLATPVLAPLAPLATGLGERPVVAIAHGLKRALIVADRLVWRLGAEPCEPNEPAPAPLLSRTVCSEEGEVFWVAEPRVLLATIELPVLPSATPRPAKPAPPVATPPTLPIPPTPRAPEPIENHPVTLVTEPPVEKEAAPIELTADDVEPLVLESADVEPLPVELQLAAGAEDLVAPVAPPVNPPGATIGHESVEETAAPIADLPAEAVEPIVEVVEVPAEHAASTEPAAATLEPAVPAVPAVSTEPAAATLETAPAETVAAVEPPLHLSTGDLIAEPSHVLPEWLERFGTAAANLERGAVPEAPAALPEDAPVVLIAEDSIAARHFLARLFEQRGRETVTVDRAADLRALLDTRRWEMVCVDVELPDARGRAFLEDTRALLAAREVPMVALVRDDEDTRLAEASGIRRWLRKPFDRDELEHLLARLGRLAGDPA